MRATPNLERLDQNHLPRDAGEGVALVMTVHNEAARLPYLFEYYRRLGVSAFYVIDNASDDDTQAYLLSQSDCAVFYTAASYAASNFGLDWQHELLDAFCTDQWALVVDADELLVYPHSNSVSLPAFCRYLQSQGREGLFTTMVDMYSAGPISEAHYERGAPFEMCTPYFDRHYEFRPRLRAPFAKPPFPPMQVVGGPRLRRFYSQYAKRRSLRLFAAKTLRNVHRRSGPLARFLPYPKSVPPLIFKVPLVRWRGRSRYTSAHTMHPAIPLADETGALLHFKYFSDFHTRVEWAIQSGMHFDEGSEYKAYQVALQQDPRLSLHYAGSVLYTGPESLLEVGLLRDSEAYQSFRSDHRSARGNQPGAPPRQPWSQR